MDTIKKQLRFFFSAGLFCAMITGGVYLSSENCFAIEQHPPFSYYEVIEQRNIFRPKTETGGLPREQAPEAQPSVEYAVSGLTNYNLTGIVKIRGKYKATITDKDSGTGYYVGVDDVIDQLKVIDIQHDRIIFERNNETYELKINVPASRVSYQKPVENTEPPAETVSPEKPLVPDETMKRRTNVMESIRMGRPNVQKD